MRDAFEPPLNLIHTFGAFFIHCCEVMYDENTIDTLGRNPFGDPFNAYACMLRICYDLDAITVANGGRTGRKRHSSNGIRC